MRVIAGAAKGRRLKGPRDHDGRTRPTSDLVRGAIFSALASMDADLSRTLDLYAGSGALGIEALSRGGDRCDFVERDPGACAVIRENLRLTGFDDSAHIICASAERALDRLEGPYTLVLADPPYADGSALELLDSLSASSKIEAGRTVLILEHALKDEPRGRLGGLALVRGLRHGDTAVSIYR